MSFSISYNGIKFVLVFSLKKNKTSPLELVLQLQEITFYKNVF